MKKTLLFLSAFLISVTAFAQNFSFGEVDDAAMAMKKYDKDTSAHAVVLNEYGTSRINFDVDYHVMITFEYHAKIKFFDNKEFEREGTFVIPVYNGDERSYEKVEDVRGF